MEAQPMVTILMATYHGDKYLVAQLESILAQTYQNWELIIRDDNSKDATQQIITDYLSTDKRIKQIKSGDLHGTACRNFSQLFDWAYQEKKQYILFADQDDVWLPNKIEQSLHHIEEEEKKYGEKTPLVKYSKFKFIDGEGNPIHTLLKLPANLSLKVLLTENYAWGCTMILNRAAIDLIKHIPPESVNHDYYIALVVSAFGRVSLIDEALVLYRQHQNNVSGNVDKMSFSSRFKRYFKNSAVMIKPLTENYALVKSFYERYSTQLPQAQRLLIAGFLAAYQAGFFELLKTLLKFGIFKIGLGKNLVYIYTLFLYRKAVVDDVYNSSKK